MAISISGGVVSMPNRCIIYGPEGVGKTTLAAFAPRAVFIDVEGGSYKLPVARIDPPAGEWRWVDVLGTLREVAQDSTQVGTIVIDTADALEALCVAWCCERDGKTDVEDWGYGKGYKVVASEFQKLVPFLDAIVKSGANVILTAHSTVYKFERPDEMGSYDRYKMKLTKFVEPILKEWADTVLFCDFKNEVTVNAKTNKAKITGYQRVMHAQHAGAYDAKNRDGLPPEMPMDFDLLLPFFPDHGRVAQGRPDAGPATTAAPGPLPVAPQAAPAAASPTPAAPPAPQQPGAAPGPQPPAEPEGEAVPVDAYDAPPATLGEVVENANAVFGSVGVAMEAPGPQDQPGGAWTPGQGAPYDPLHPTEGQVGDAESYELFGYPPSHKTLADLMNLDGVTDEQLRRYMSAQAMQPYDLPVAQYSAPCVNWLADSWSTKVAPEIKAMAA